MYTAGKRLRRPVGRPPRDGLALFLLVEGERLLRGLSVNAFCKKYYIVVRDPTKPDRKLWDKRVGGRTLRRRYTEFLTSIRIPAPPSGMILPPKMTGLPAHIEQLVAERVAALKNNS